MIKLKKLIKESAWDRKFGDPLLTLKDIAEKHQGKEIQKLNEADESTWTWIYKGMLAGLKKAGGSKVNLEEVARAAAFLVKTEFGSGAKNDFIKPFKRWL